MYSDYKLDLGNYPINPWLDNQIIFKSQLFEDQNGQAFLEGTYELKQAPNNEMVTVKNFYSAFDPPDDTGMVHVVKFGDFSPKLSISEYDFLGTDFLEANEITADELIDYVEMINKKIEPYRNPLVKQSRIMMLYTLLGIFVVTVCSILFSIYLSFFFAIFMVILYFIGLYKIRRKTREESVKAEKTVIFNLALILHNLNASSLESKCKLKCKVGHLAQWVEFHSLRSATEVAIRSSRRSHSEEEEGICEESRMVDDSDK